jgi:threonine/homoserine/homoserine lactone efflux protein
MADELAAFLAVSIVVIVMPGPDTALTIRNALVGGRRAGILTAAGVASGQAFWTLAAAGGVTALLVASEPAFRAVKLLGAAYLVFLGLHALRAAVRPRTPALATTQERARPGRPSLAAYRQGLVSNLANPKMAVFFTSLLPQFASGGEASFWPLLGLGLLFCALTLTWLTGYALAVAKAGELLRRSSLRRALDAFTGAVLVALGIRLATERP